MFLKKRWIGLFFVYALVAALLFACSAEDQNAVNPNPAPEKNAEENTAGDDAINEESTGAGEGDAVSGNENEGSGEVVELILYTNSGDSLEAMHTMLEPFNKQHPHTNITPLTNASGGMNMTELLASNVKIDLFYHGRGAYENALIEYNLMYDMTDLLRQHDVNIDHLEPTAVDSIRDAFDGAIYGLPVNLNTLIFMYNKAIFDQFGVDYPEDGMTWEEMSALASRLTRTEDRDYFGYGMNNPVFSWTFNSLSIPIVDVETNQPTINTDPRWRTMLQHVYLDPSITEAYQRIGKIPNWASFSVDQNVAMVLATTGQITASPAELQTLDWDMVSVPVFSETPDVGPRASPVYFGITSLSEHPDLAIEAIKYWTSEEYQVNSSKQGRLMASKADAVLEAYGSETAFPDKNWASITYHPFAPLVPVTVFENNVRNVYRDNVTSLISGEMDMNTVLRAMEEKAEQVIQELMMQQ